MAYAEQNSLAKKTHPMEQITCKTLDQTLYPPLDPEADVWFQQALDMAQPKGVPIDFSEVANLYQKAVNKAHYKAMNNLAVLYIRGLGVTKDDQKAVALYQKMADMNLPEGHMAVGRSIDKGRAGLRGGGPVALGHYARAARQGHPKAQTIIGWQLLKKYAMRSPQGIYMLECALKQDYPDAAYRLATYYKTWKIFPKTVHYYRIGAKLGQENCFNQLEKAYAHGKLGLNKDHDRALCLFYLKEKLVKDSSLKFPDLNERCPGSVEQPY